MKFEIHQDKKQDKPFRLKNAYMFGTDDVVLRKAKITCKDNVITCSKPSNETAGLSLLWKVDGYGEVEMATTCLPEKGNRYNLNLELARAKLMQIITKQQEWSLFDESNEIEKLLKQAKQLFIEAVNNTGEPVKSAQFADKAIYKAMLLAEKLADTNSDKAFDKKSKNHLFTRGCLGCKVTPSMLKQKPYAKCVLDLFGFVTVPVNWRQIEKKRGEFDFTQLDFCIKAFSNKKIGVGAGPLLRFTPSYIPEWLIKEKPNFQQILEYAYEFITEITKRYSRMVRFWKILGGINCYNCFGFNFEQIIEISRASAMAVKNNTERAIKVIEIANPWGEYYALKSASIPPTAYIDMLVQSGIDFDAFGLDLRFGGRGGCLTIRDMMSISAMLDSFSVIGKPVHITEFSAESLDSKENNSENFGWWHKKWDPEIQAKWIKQFYKIALSKPYIDTVTYSSIADTPQNADSGLLDKNLKPKQAYKSIKDIKKVIFKD